MTIRLSKTKLEPPWAVVQAILFDKNIYSYSDCIRWLLFNGLLKYKHFTITYQCMKFKFREPDETKYNYSLEREEVGIWFIKEYPKVK